MKRIKQINNLVIYQDTAEKINFFGEIKDNPNFGKYLVYSPDKICLEDRLTLAQAEEFCIETKDYLKTSLNDKINIAKQNNNLSSWDVSDKKKQTELTK